MFSPLVMISEVPNIPPTSEVSASARMVRGTSRCWSTGLPTASLIASAWPVASTIEITANTISGIAATTSKVGMPNGNGVGSAITGVIDTWPTWKAPVSAAASAPPSNPSRIASCASMPVSNRDAATVQAMVANASSRLSGSTVVPAAGWPAISRPDTCARLIATSSSIVPTTTGGK
ncbi:hypothetical protein D9M69_598560 [compost metagenome]